MKNKIFMAISILCITLFAIFLGYFVGTHKIIITKNTDNKIFVKNGFRFKITEPPKNYVSDEQVCNSEFVHTERYYLYKIFEFQQMTPDERIKEFEKLGMDSLLLSENFGLYAERGKQYKIAENYCISTVANEYYANKVNCNKMALSVDKLPYERAIAFEEKDNEGIVYKSYIKELWKEFKSTGVKGLEAQLQKEYDTHRDECQKQEMAELHKQGMECDPLIVATHDICVPVPIRR